MTEIGQGRLMNAQWRKENHVKSSRCCLHCSESYPDLQLDRTKVICKIMHKTIQYPELICTVYITDVCPHFH